MANFSGTVQQSFYSLKDFYEFIKTPLYAPVDHKHNVVQLYIKPELNTAGEIITTSMYNKLFSGASCRAFSLSIQKVDTPDLTIGNGVTSDTPLGYWSSPNNNTLRT